MAQLKLVQPRPWRGERGLEPVLGEWLAGERVRPCFAAERDYEPSEARTAPLPASLHPSIARALASRGIDALYTHQGAAFELASRGRSFVVATPTASGKSLCFHLPVLDAMLRDPDARALYLFPTKALARDQEASVRELMTEAGGGIAIVTYDGDTPGDARRAAREKSHVIVTNPDMLHAGVLPHHTSWARMFQALRFVVVDELHTYRGVFGSHVANVIRRLMRVAAFHGSNPLLIGATATIGNPREHAARLFGKREDEVELVGESGAPRGARKFFFYNPPVVNEELGIRASYVKQTVSLAADLVRARVPTIVFGPSRNSVEMMLRYLREKVARDKIEPSKIMAYRGGYLPEQRRDIERRLRSGDILCVVATNALELGIDVGALDAVVCASYPGSVAAMWQRFGRAGRRGALSICVLVACSAPLDQFLAREPEYLLSANVEEARIDADNVEVLVQHLKCAAFELPFRRGESFGSVGAGETGEALDFLASHRVLHESGGNYHWATDAYPANAVSLRSVGWDNVVIIDVEHDKVLGELDWPAAHTMLHEQAIYQHDGETWQVERFDYENHKAYVRKVEPDYFTTALTHKKVSILEVEAESSPLVTAWGDVSVVEKVVGYKKVKFNTHENTGYGDVHLPAMQMHTTSFWLRLGDDTRHVAPPAQRIDGLRGLGIALETVATFRLMCDPRDLGMTLDDGREEIHGQPTMFLYEHVPGGSGLAERIFSLREELFARALRLVTSCACAAGCPACVGPGESGERKRVAAELLRLLASSS
ncbi:MAG TPA: DEAD/DEAH box helicase [Polyangiaceae bacterium]|jgi:DEAD/DEAH box helicase domain-containing protein